MEDRLGQRAGGGQAETEDPHGGPNREGDLPEPETAPSGVVYNGGGTRPGIAHSHTKENTVAVNSVRNVKSADRIGNMVELLDEEFAKARPSWSAVVKRGFKTIEGLSPRNVADAQTAFLATRRPSRIETDLYQIALEQADGSDS